MKTLKKLLLLTSLLLLSCFSFAGCGKNEIMTNTNSQNGIENIDNDIKDMAESIEYMEEEMNISYAHDFYYDCPTRYTEKTNQYGAYYIPENDKFLVGVYYDRDYGCGDEKQWKNDSLEKVIDFANDDGFHWGPFAETYQTQYWLDEFMITSSDIVTIAGRESMQFEGTAFHKNIRDESEEEKWNCYIYGYTFILDEISYAVVGAVLDKEQDEEAIEEMKKLTDFVASSFRTEMFRK